MGARRASSDHNVTNYRDLQLPSGLHDLDRWLGQQQFTHAAVMGPHIPEYYGEPSSKKVRSTHARQMASWADQLWNVLSSHFDPNTLIHVMPWFGTVNALGLVDWPPPGDEAGLKATTFDTTEQLGSRCGADLDLVTPHEHEDFLGIPCENGELHQCIAVCQRNPGAAPSNCKAAPFVHMAQQFVELVRRRAGSADEPAAAGRTHGAQDHRSGAARKSILDPSVPG